MGAGKETYGARGRALRSAIFGKYKKMLVP